MIIGLNQQQKMILISILKDVQNVNVGGYLNGVDGNEFMYRKEKEKEIKERKENYLL